MNQVLDVLLSSQSNEWYTPATYIEAARSVMGSIDLDPASSEQANQVVKATRYFNEMEDGLKQFWYGNVWLNPPYGRATNPGQHGQTSNQGIWSRKLISEFKSGTVKKAILLVNLVPGYKWFAPLWDYPMCAVDHCISFTDPNGQKLGRAKASSAFVYMGGNVQRFYEVFCEFGPIINRTFDKRLLLQQGG